MTRLPIVAIALLCLTASAAVAQTTRPAWTPMLTGSQDYSAWKEAKEGSWAQFSTSSTRNGKTDQGEETFTLAKVAPEKLTLARKVTKTDASGKASTQSAEFTLTPMSGSGPMATGKFEKGTEYTEGDEDLKVADQTLKCHWRKLKVTRDTGYYAFTIWTNPAIPGLIVKQTGETSMQKPDGVREESTTERLLIRWGTEPIK